MGDVRTPTRPYGGRSAQERQAERRQRLIDAALEIWGDHGWAAVTMRGVCARAGLIDRYFYESFADRDALLLAVWDQMRDETVLMLGEAIMDVAKEPPLEQLRAAISAFVHGVLGDPRRARIAFGEHAGSPALEERRHTTLAQFATLLIAVARPHLGPDVDETRFRISVLMGVAGFVEMIWAWRAGTIDATPEEIIDHATEVATDLAARYLQPAH